MATKREIKAYMRGCLAEHIDRCDEVNATGLAEDACANFDDYGVPPNYDIPERYFEVAGELAMAYEKKVKK